MYIYIYIYIYTYKTGLDVTHDTQNAQILQM